MSKDLALAASGEAGATGARVDTDGGAGKWLALLAVGLSGLLTLGFWIAVGLLVSRWL